MHRSPKVVSLAHRRPLNSRREIQVELPEFLIVLLEERVKEANDGSTDDEIVTVDNLVEYQIAEMLTLRAVAEFEMKLPGFSDAVQEWIAATRE